MNNAIPATRENEPRPCLTREEIGGRFTVTIPEGGAVIGLGRGASYAAAKRGEIPTIRVGRKILVPVAALLRMLGEDVPTVTPPIRRPWDVQGHYAGPLADRA